MYRIIKLIHPRIIELKQNKFKLSFENVQDRIDVVESLIIHICSSKLDCTDEKIKIIIKNKKHNFSTANVYVWVLRRVNVCTALGTMLRS